jgi:hypothetical protein
MKREDLLSAFVFFVTLNPSATRFENLRDHLGNKSLLSNNEHCELNFKSIDEITKFKTKVNELCNSLSNENTISNLNKFKNFLNDNFNVYQHLLNADKIIKHDPNSNRFKIVDKEVLRTLKKSEIQKQISHLKSEDIKEITKIINDFINPENHTINNHLNLVNLALDIDGYNELYNICKEIEKEKVVDEISHQQQER